MNAHTMAINQKTCFSAGATTSGNPTHAGMPVPTQRSWYCSTEVLKYYNYFNLKIGVR